METGFREGEEIEGVYGRFVFSSGKWIKKKRLVGRY